MSWIIAVVVVCVIIGLWAQSEDRRFLENKKSIQDKLIADKGVQIDSEYTFENELSSVFIRFIVDAKHENVYFSNMGSEFTAIPFSKIIGCEIITDSEVTGGVGRAVVGGVIAGGAGAIVGATTAKKHIMSCSLVIYKNTIKDPTITLNLINTKTKTTDDVYRKAMAFANNVNASIKAILDLKNRAEISRRAIVTETHIDPTEELRKYKALLDEGIITEADFEQKKRQLLKL